MKKFTPCIWIHTVELHDKATSARSFAFYFYLISKHVSL